MGLIREALKGSPATPYFRKAKAALEGLFIDGAETLIFVHIGKCGGSSLQKAIDTSPVVASKFKRVIVSHGLKPPIIKSAKYLIVVRNPISRALSAFNWRYRLVVEEKSQATRFKNEYGILKRYGTLDQLASSLYDENDSLDENVARDYRSIFHLREDISFYLTDLLKYLSKDQIFSVIMTESLNGDIANTLDVHKVHKERSNKNSTPQDKMILTERSEQNLRRFLKDDYSAVSSLLDLIDAPEERRSILLK